jgi:hypothetical protein
VGRCCAAPKAALNPLAPDLPHPGVLPLNIEATAFRPIAPPDLGAARTFVFSRLVPANALTVCGKRFSASDLLPYIIAQVVGAIAAAGVLYVIASGKEGFSLAGGFASNGYAAHSPGGYSLTACVVAEVVLTFMFLVIILGATDRRAPQGFAPIPIGLGLTLVHLIGIPVTNLSVNPARSTGPAIFVGGLGGLSTVAVLGGSDCGRCTRGGFLPNARRRRQG